MGWKEAAKPLQLRVLREVAVLVDAAGTVILESRVDVEVVQQTHMFQQLLELGGRLPMVQSTLKTFIRLISRLNKVPRQIRKKRHTP